ncbi:DUF6894 family protein [Sphingomonas sp. PB4P5]|uniref:DUF6894 family protein n=1 Tax=Parasphingomonas puruogangriensis TaxID=3096155 RepID=UPI002FC92358
MQRFYFHVFNDEETRDEIGQVFSNLAAAQTSAELDCVALAAASVTEHRHLIMHHRIEIEDKTGAVLSTVRFGDVIDVRR